MSCKLLIVLVVFGAARRARAERPIEVEAVGAPFAAQDLVAALRVRIAAEGAPVRIRVTAIEQGVRIASGGAVRDVPLADLRGGDAARLVALAADDLLLDDLAAPPPSLPRARKATLGVLGGAAAWGGALGGLAVDIVVPHGGLVLAVEAGGARLFGGSLDVTAATVRATAGLRAGWLELRGPARLEIEGVPGDATRVRLRDGVLVAEFTGGPGRSLHIDAPGAGKMLYQSAEAALGKHDLAAADRSLAALVAEFADSPLVEEAVYERARIAYQRHAWSDARRQLERLAQDRGSPLAEPGAYLACRIDVETHDETTARCLADYRKTYPSSPHDVDVLGLLVDLAYRDGGCARAAPAIDDLARSHPRAPLLKAWRARCETPK